MSLTATGYPLGYRHLGRGRIGDLLAADVRLMLATSGYTPAPADEWAATPAAYETAGNGYPAGGIALPNKGFDTDPATGRAILTCDQILFSAATFICRWVIIYVNTGSLAAAPLLSYVDLGGDINPAGLDLPLTFSGGVYRIGGPQ